MTTNACPAFLAAASAAGSFGAGRPAVPPFPAHTARPWPCRCRTRPPDRRTSRPCAGVPGPAAPAAPGCACASTTRSACDDGGSPRPGRRGSHATTAGKHGRTTRSPWADGRGCGDRFIYQGLHRAPTRHAGLISPSGRPHQDQDGKGLSAACREVCRPPAGRHGVCGDLRKHFSIRPWEPFQYLSNSCRRVVVLPAPDADGLAATDAMKERGLPLFVGDPEVDARVVYAIYDDGRPTERMTARRLWAWTCTGAQRAGPDDRGRPAAGTARITNSPAELRGQIDRAGKHPKVVLEATYGWVRSEGA